jgi:hypothetical protein
MSLSRFSENRLFDTVVDDQDSDRDNDRDSGQDHALPYLPVRARAFLAQLIHDQSPPSVVLSACPGPAAAPG